MLNAQKVHNNILPTYGAGGMLKCGFFLFHLLVRTGTHETERESEVPTFSIFFESTNPCDGECDASVGGDGIFLERGRIYMSRHGMRSWCMKVGPHLDK